MGAQLVREVAVKTNDVAGDGTTTATLLADVIVSEGLTQRDRRRRRAGHPPRHREGHRRRRGRHQGRRRPRCPPRSRSPTSARISAGDAAIGDKIAEAMDAVGNDGAISVEESQTVFGLDMDIVEGMQYDRGYISPYMATDMEKMEAVLKDPFILLTDHEDQHHPGHGSAAGGSHARPAARCSSSPRTSRARLWPPSCSTACAAP